MGKPILRPTVHHMRAVYEDYARKLLEAHPEWWGKYERRLKLKNCYIYAKEKGRVVEKMSWLIYKEALERYFHSAKDAIIQGESLRLGSNLGVIRAVRIQRNFANPEVNWGETFRQNLRDEQDRLIRIYYTDEDYCRIQWAKTGSVANETLYHFQPAAKNMASGKGFKKDFVNALNKDPLLKYRYKYYPLKNYRKCNTDTAVCEMSLAE